MRNPFRVRRSRRQAPPDENLPAGYPAAYAQQESQVLQQIAARRKAFLQQADQNEQQFTGAAPQQSEMIPKRAAPGAMEEEKVINDLFAGDVLG
jgi:hypothetical protein